MLAAGLVIHRSHPKGNEINYREEELEDGLFSGTLRLLRFRDCLSDSVHKVCYCSHGIAGGLHTSDDGVTRYVEGMRVLGGRSTGGLDR